MAYCIQVDIVWTYIQIWLKIIWPQELLVFQWRVLLIRDRMIPVQQSQFQKFHMASVDSRKCLCHRCMSNDKIEVQGSLRWFKPATDGTSSHKQMQAPMSQHMASQTAGDAFEN